MTQELPADVAGRLATERNVWLTTVRPDGSPHTTPVWFVFAGTTWWISCEQRSVKVRNVVAQPRVSLALEDGDAPVVAEGVAAVRGTDVPADVVEAFAAKYDGWDIRVPDTPDRPRAVLEIAVSRWLLLGTAR